MLRVSDDLGRELIFHRAPVRVVSLVPSETYNWCRLGGQESIVGRTDYCVLPLAVQEIPSVGGTKNFSVEKVLELKPDLVLANKEENTESRIRKLVDAGVRVFVSFPKTVSQGLSHVARLGRILDAGEVSRPILKEAYESFQKLKVLPHTGRRIFVPIWNEPLMTFNELTFASDVLDVVGVGNIFAHRERKYPLMADIGRGKPLSPEEVADRDTRYPRVTWEEVRALGPNFVWLPDEPYAFSERDRREFSEQLGVSEENVMLISGQALFWPGLRAIELAEELLR